MTHTQVQLFDSTGGPVYGASVRVLAVGSGEVGSVLTGDASSFCEGGEDVFEWIMALKVLLL